MNRNRATSMISGMVVVAALTLLPLHVLATANCYFYTDSSHADDIQCKTDVHCGFHDDGTGFACKQLSNPNETGCCSYSWHRWHYDSVNPPPDCNCAVGANAGRTYQDITGVTWSPNQICPGSTAGSEIKNTVCSQADGP